MLRGVGRNARGVREAVDKGGGQVDHIAIHTDRGLSRGLLIVSTIPMYQSMLVRLNRSVLASFSAIFALALAGGGLLIAPSMALAAHTATVSVAPEAVKGGESADYTLTFTNVGSDSVYRIDITAPSGFSVNTESVVCPTDWNSSNLSATTIRCAAVDAFDGPGLITAGNQGTITFVATAPITNDANAEWSVVSRDSVASTATATDSVLVDSLAPVTTDDVASSSDWTSDDVTVTLSSDDGAGSGVASILYSTDGSAPATPYTAPFPLSTSGTYTLKYSATDAVGNVEDAVTGSAVQIDKDAPAISNATIAYPDSQTAAKKGDTITISVTADDGPGSGVASVTTDLSSLGGLSAYALDKVEDTNVYSATYLIPSDESVTALDGDVSLPLTVTDAVENVTSGNTEVFVFDNQVPTGSVSISAPEGQTAIKDDDSIDVSGSVDGTGSDASVVSATLRQFNGEAEIGTGIDVTGSVSLTDGTLSGNVSVGTLDENATAIKLEIVIKDGANSQVVLTSGSIAVDNTSPSFTSAEITPPGSQTKVKNVDTIQVEVETDSNTANTVTIDASAFGASNSIPLSPKDGSATAFTGSFVVTDATTGAHSIQTSVLRTNNGASVSGPSGNQLEVDNTLPAFETITANPNPAKAGTVTITFTASETLAGDPSVTVNSQVATKDEELSSGLAYTYTYEVTGSDAQGVATISVVGLDLAANSGETEDTSLVIDTVKPLVTTVDSDGASFSAGDHTITVTFDEDVKDSPVPQIAVAYSATAGTCSDVSATNMTKVNATQYSYVLVVSDDCDAATGTVSISTAQDSAGNEMVVDSTHTFSVDTVAPELVSAQTGDADGNGQIDTITASFSEDLNGETVALSDFSVVGYTVTNATEDSGVVTLTITESGTPDTGATPLVSVVGSVEDSTGNAVTSGSVTAQDKAKPVMVSARTTSLTTIDVTFSEPVNGSSLGSGDFSVADNTITNRAKNGDNVVTLTLGSAIGTGETPAVTVNGDGTGSGGVGVKDNVTANNWTVQHSIASENVDDGIAPVVAIVTLDPVSPVKAGVVGITVTFSEDMYQAVPLVVTYDPQGSDSGATAQTITGGYTSATTWVGSFTVPTDDAANYDGEAVISISAGQDLNNENVMAEDTTNSFTVDTTAPTLTDVSAPEGVIRGIVSVAFTATGADSCFYKIDDGDPQEIADCTSPATIAVADHKHTITLTAQDMAGNESTSVSIDVLIDLDQNLTVGSSGEDFTTIQAAINAATSGDTISVAEGTYTENLTFSESVTVTGAGKTNTTITGTHIVTANDVTVRDVALSLAGSGTIFTLDSSSNPISGFEVTNSNFNMPTSPSVGISIGEVGTSQKVSSVTINNNTFNGPSDKNANPWKIGGSFGFPKGVEVENLTFQGNTVNQASTPINLYDKNLTNIVIDDNTYNNTDGAVYVWEDSGSATPTGVLSGFEFTNNVLNVGNTYGLAFFGWTGSIPLNSSQYTDTNFGSGNVVNDNDFSNITGGYGLGSLSFFGTFGSFQLNAEANWWGTSDGTAIAAKVLGTVDYRPWYLSADLIDLDSDSPTPVIASSAGTLTNVSPIPVTVNFGETVTGFVAGDVAVGNGSVSGFDGSGATYTFNVTPTIDGAVTVNIAASVAEDASGNFNDAAIEFSITYDSTAPTATITGAPASLTNVTSTDITVAGTDVTHYQYKLDTDLDYGAETPVTSHIILSGLAEGEHTVSVIGRDAAGNYQSVATTATWTVDTQAPTASLTGTPAALTNATTATVTVGGDGVVAYQYKLDGGSYSAERVIATAIELSGLAAGSHTLSVIGKDEAGNWQLESAATTHTWTIDTTAPSVTGKTPGVNALNVDPNDNITVVFSKAVVAGEADITLQTGTDPAVVTVVTGTGTNTLVINPSTTLDSNSVYDVTLATTITDEAGNALLSTVTWSFTTATSYSIALESGSGGWNLISLPINPISTAIATVLGSSSSAIDAVWTYAPNDVGADDSGWFVYYPNNLELVSNLTTMTAGYGYWVSVTADTTLSGSGSLLSAQQVPPSRNLSAGWNLVGYYQIPGESASSMDDAFSSIGVAAVDYTSLWGYNNMTGAFSSVHQTAVDAIQPGEAFWISVPTSGKVYTPSNLN